MILTKTICKAQSKITFYKNYKSFNQASFEEVLPSDTIYRSNLFSFLKFLLRNIKQLKKVSGHNPTGIYLFNVNNKNNRTIREIHLK